MANKCKSWLAAAALAALAACQPNNNAPKTADYQETESGQEQAGGGELEIDFTMPSMDGNSVNVTEEFAKHKLTIIDFWASWCGPCIREMPNLVNIYNEYKDKGLGIIGVSLDEDERQWTKAVNTMGMDWTQLSDLQGWNNAAAQMYGIQSIPFTIVVDNKGKVVAAGLRGEELAAFVNGKLGQAGTGKKAAR